MSLLATLLQALEDDEQEMIAIRRHLHAHPEVSFHEKQTAAYIKAYYTALDMSVVPCGDGYGMYVDIEAGSRGRNWRYGRTLMPWRFRKIMSSRLNRKIPGSCTLAAMMRTRLTYWYWPRN